MPASPCSADSPSGLEPSGDSSLSCLIASFFSSRGLSDAMPPASGDDCRKGRQTPQIPREENSSSQKRRLQKQCKTCRGGSIRGLSTGCPERLGLAGLRRRKGPVESRAVVISCAQSVDKLAAWDMDQGQSWGNKARSVIGSGEVSVTGWGVANQGVRSVVGQLQSRQFGSVSGTWSLIDTQDRLALFPGTSVCQSVVAGCQIVETFILGSPAISKLTVTGRRVCVCKEKAGEGRFIRN